MKKIHNALKLLEEIVMGAAPRSSGPHEILKLLDELEVRSAPTYDAIREMVYLKERKKRALSPPEEPYFTNGLAVVAGERIFLCRANEKYVMPKELPPAIDRTLLFSTDLFEFITAPRVRFIDGRLYHSEYHVVKDTVEGQVKMKFKGDVIDILANSTTMALESSHFSGMRSFSPGRGPYSEVHPNNIFSEDAPDGRLCDNEGVILRGVDTVRINSMRIHEGKVHFGAVSEKGMGYVCRLDDDISIMRFRKGRVHALCSHEGLLLDGGDEGIVYADKDRALWEFENPVYSIESIPFEHWHALTGNCIRL